MVQVGVSVKKYLVPLAWANLAVNIGIVVTGGAVRLTGSGLGCPTWPQCDEGSFVPHGALDINKAIEFGNRTLTFVLVVVALACWAAALAARPERGREPFRLATVVALGIPAQALLGGVTVLTDLNPWVVALHFLISMGIVSVCVWLVDDLDGPERGTASAVSAGLAWSTFAAGWAVLWLGTVVTGSGPHAGDLKAKRTGLDPATVSQVHGVAVWLLVALTIGLVAVALVRGERLLAAFAAVLLGIELAQGVLGYVQYFTDLPVVLVALHMLGAALVAAGLARVVLTTREKRVS